MTRSSRLRPLFYVNLVIIAAVVAYKVYLNIFEVDFEGIHTRQVARIQERLANRDSFSFAVVGNINNSVGIFERRMVPRLNASGVDFVVSAGNAVSDGGEDKYRALHGSLSHMEMPYLLTFGENEQSRLGSFRFYEHFGPYFYAFSAGDARLIFLDTTGKTPYSWQLRWLRDELAAGHGKRVFLFMGHPLYKLRSASAVEPERYMPESKFRSGLLNLIDRYRVDAVFAANAPLYNLQRYGATDFVITGGAGGLVLNHEDSFYHYVTVKVTPEAHRLELERLESGQHSVFKVLESFWFFIHSLFYVGYLNFLLLLSVLIAVAYKLHQVVFTERHYYRRFDLDPTPYLSRSLRVAHFTNNYLPFVGGVPISIERLRRGLRKLRHEVLVVAPRYERQEQEEGVFRVPALLQFGTTGEFRLANLWFPRIRRRLDAFGPDLVHVHHPFWLGGLGLRLARRRRLPVIYTYHTRLEHYAHFVPLPGLLFRNLISHYLIKRFANRCDGVIVPTYSAEEYLRVIGVTTPILVQPSGVDYGQFGPVSDEEVADLRRQLGLLGKRVLVSVSRLSREKNIDFLIDAIHELKRTTQIPFRFLMIGEGAERARVQARVSELGLEDTFILVGRVSPERVSVYYRLSDAFLFASQSETQGMVILEAMAAGLPVVAVRSSGIDDVIQDGVNGYKTIPEHADHWCARVRELLADENLCNRLGDNARQYARAFDIEPVAQEVGEFYAEILAAHEKRHPAATGATGRAG